MDVELAPVEAMLDEIHQSLPTSRGRNSYTLGRMGEHNVVIAVMPEIGNSSAAIVATQLLNDFKSIRFGLLVGIGGGIPGDDEDDIRLGDVVVSKPTLEIVDSFRVLRRFSFRFGAPKLAYAKRVGVNFSTCKRN